MTDDLLARLRELEAAATKGPWYAADWQQDDGPNPFTIEERYQAEPSRPGYTCVWPNGIGHRRIAETEEGVNPLADAALIVAMRNALPDLLARIEAMAGEIEGLREALAMAIPRNVCLTNRNIADSYVVPIEVTMGELRSMAAALTAPSMKENEDETRG